MRRWLPSACIALCLAAPAWAETVYVTDILQLGIHHAPDTSDKPFDVLVSGTPLEVLERSGFYARVRTPDGREGWVKSGYVVTEKPARRRLAELEAELDRLRLQLAEAEAARELAEQASERLDADLAGRKASLEEMEASLARLAQQNEEYEARFDRYRLSLPLPWVAGALALTLVGGFAGGWCGLDALIRRRHGGFRVY
ncbi:MAG TPA: TIGR04211 family SH3 domain-containing protein [Gammaproteobacteria bacterium]